MSTNDPAALPGIWRARAAEADTHDTLAITRHAVAKAQRQCADELDAARPGWQALLIEADSMLSAYGYGRAITKGEALELSGRLRRAYEQTGPVPPRAVPPPQVEEKKDTKEQDDHSRL